MTELETVQPGDLITADFMNSLIGELTTLKGRVAILEGGTGPTPTTGPPVLTRREPVGDVRVGGLLALIGNGFAPVEKASVHLGNVTLDKFTPDSNNTRLAFQVPAQFPTLPLSTKVSVETPQGQSGALAIQIQEATQVQGGKVVVGDQSAVLPAIVAGTSYTLAWSVASNTLQPATYDFKLLFSGVNPITLLGDWEKAALSTTQEKITAGAPLTVTANVTVPAGAVEASVALHAASTDGQFSHTSSATTLKVGVAPDVSDPKTTFVLEKQPPQYQPDPTKPATDNPVQYVGGTIEVDFGASGQIDVKVTPTETGLYKFTSAIDTLGGAGGWALEPINPISAQVAAGAQVTVHYGIKNLGTAASPPPETFFIARAARRNAGDTADTYVSFVKFPIRGAEVV